MHSLVSAVLVTAWGGDTCQDATSHAIVPNKRIEKLCNDVYRLCSSPKSTKNNFNQMFENILLCDIFFNVYGWFVWVRYLTFFLQIPLSSSWRRWHHYLTIQHARVTKKNRSRYHIRCSWLAVHQQRESAIHGRIALKSQNKQSPSDLVRVRGCWC